MRVVHFHRRPGLGCYSLERYFDDVRNALPTEIAVEILVNRYGSPGLIRRCLDTLRAYRHPQGAARGPLLPSERGAAEVFRATIRDLEAGSLKQNIDLQDGDTLYVPRAESAYVFGQVRNPGAYPIQKGTTVLQALSLAGGVTEHGAINRITIVRVVKGEQKEIKAKLTDVVQPGDTIKVPERYFQP